MEKIVRGCCPHDCPDTCGWLVTVRDGVAVEIKGDPHHPFTRGWLCVKVRAYLQFVYHPDRLLYPLKRVGAKGEGRFRRISWDEALDTIASKWQEIIARYGPEAILPYSYSGTLGVVQNDGLDRRFFNRLGASELERTICSAAGMEGVRYSLGANKGADPESMVHAKLILIWGANPATTHPHYIPFIQDAKRRGARVVLIDPRRTRTAPFADQHLQIFPGTDAALALGMMRAMVDHGWHDQDYVEANTVGFDELKERLVEYPLDRVARVTGIREKDVLELACAYASTKPAFLRLGYGVQRHGNGGMIVRTIACLPALAGQVGLRGGGFLLSTSGWAPWDNVALRRPDLRPREPRAINMNQLGQALLSAEPPIKSLYVYNSNPAASTPNQSKVRVGLLRDDLFTVVHEIFPTDTVDYADIALPATTQLERVDLHKAYGNLYVQLNEPAIAPRGECKSNTEVFRLLAGKMGFKEECLFESDEDMARTAVETLSLSGPRITLERLRQEGAIKITEKELGLPFADGRFTTPSGKVEFYSRQLREAGVDPLPAHVPEREGPEGDKGLLERYPLYLLTPGAHHFLNTTFANVPSLVAL
ncbi:MAG: molybdopterin-dependent oxidoreductase, partial [Chloroflexi bacterium]|nr:molybdopterin-dependent oxidoreductase [Chloroflexota bacterium]